MKKFTLLLIVAVTLLVSACSGGYNEKKCRELLDKNVAELTVNDVEYMLDQCDVILDSFPKEFDEETINSLANDPKMNMLTKLSAKVAAFQFDCMMNGRDVPESIQKKMEKVVKKAGEILQ